MKIDKYKNATVKFFKKRAAKSAGSEDESGAEMSFLEHLEEFRDVVIKCLIALVIAFIVATVGFHYLNKGLMYPLNAAKGIIVNYFDIADTPPPAQAEKIGPFFLVKYGDDGKEVAKEGPFFMESEATAALEGATTLTRLKNGDLNAMAWHSKIQLRAMSFQTPIVLWFSVGLMGAVGLALPFMLYFIAKFIAPGLTTKERRIMKPTIAVAVLLFFIGSAFAFFFMLPMGIAFMAWMSQNMGLEMFPDAQSYYMMVIFLTLVVGITFEVPLLLTVLIYLGVLNPDVLKKNRRMVFLVILIFATVVTPPDCITQVSLAIPLYLLYELALVIGVKFRNKKLKREAEEERLAEIQDEKERREYIASEAAKRRAEEEEENEGKSPAKKYDDGLPDDYDPNKDDEYEDHHHYDYDDDDEYDPYGLDDDYDPEEFDRLKKSFSPNWQLNEPDLSFFTPNFKEDEVIEKPTEENGENKPVEN